MNRLIYLLAACMLIPASLFANVELPYFFSDNMVLQRDHSIPVWGWASPNEKVTLTFHGQTKTVKTGKDGKWRVDFSAESAGGPYAMTINGKNSIEIKNVLIGDVWICSGQSNMEMPIAGWGKINHYEQEIAEANYPKIRQFLVTKAVASQPKDTLAGGSWTVCNPENAGDYSAVAYFFGRTLNQELDIPIGLINTTWGGTQVESWTSREAYENSDEFSSMIASMKNLNLDELMKERDEAFRAHLKTLQGEEPTAAAIASWKNPDFDDAAWHSLTVPGLWEQQEPGNIDGYIWVRKTIELTADQAGKAATLELAMIDDNDETYLNGKKIGATTGYNAKRGYTIPAGALKPGKNTIAVRVEDTGGGGGIWGDAADVKLGIDGKNIPLAGDWKYRVEKISTGSGAVNPNSYPTLLYNAMVAPLIPYAIKGAIWYQGEANAGRAYQYRKAFPLMIEDWRNQWGQGDFPFYFVQLATFGADNGTSANGSSWAELREAQTMTLSLPNTGMAVTTDIGNVQDIHPKNKQDVGKRLALIALHNDYGKEVVYSGPVYDTFRIQGSTIQVSFTQTGNGLMAKDKYGYVKGFEVAGADQQFHYAQAQLHGNEVWVSCEAVPNPVAVRYGWADDASDDNLFNKEGLPAGPFRTDDWKGKTAGVRYQISGQ